MSGKRRAGRRAVCQLPAKIALLSLSFGHKPAGSLASCRCARVQGLFGWGGGAIGRLMGHRPWPAWLT